MNAVKFFFVGLIFASSVNAEQYGPYNQQQTYNYNTGCSSWQSCFGPGINSAAVTLLGGLVNAMSRPDPVQYIQTQQQPVYVGNNPQQQVYNQVPNKGNCSMQTLYDRSGNPRYVKICD